MNRTIDTHPLYTLLPVPHSALLNQFKVPLIDFLSKISIFLTEKASYATLICDHATLKILSSVVTLDELVDYRILTVQELEKNRERQPDVFAVYFISSLQESLTSICNDFGGAPLLKIDEVIKLRKQEKCCVRQNREFQPYSYRGCFIAFSSNFDHLTKMIEKANLKYVSSYPVVINMDFHVKNRFVSLNVDSKLCDIYSKDQEAYTDQVSNKLQLFFENIKMQPKVFHQTSSKLAEKIKSKLDFKEYETQANLIILDRKTDLFSVLFFSNEFTSLFKDLSHNENQIDIQYEKQDEIVRETVEIETEVLDQISRYGIINGVNSVFQTFNDFNALKRGQTEFKKDSQLLEITALSQHEKMLLQPLFLSISNKIWNLFKIAKFIDNKQQLITNIQSFQNSLFSSFLAKDFNLFLELPISQQETRNTLAFLFSLSTRPDFDSEDALRLFLSVILFALSTNQKDEQKFIQQMLSDEFYEEKLPLDVKYRKVAQNFVKFIDFDYFENLSFYDKKQAVYSPLVCQLLTNLFSSQKLPLLTPVFKIPFKPQISKSNWTFQDELLASKNVIFKEENENLTEFDKKQIIEKEKIFIYINFGISQFEICALEKVLEEKYGKIGIYNRGIEGEYDVEVYLISDKEVTGKEFVDQFM